MYTVSGMTDKNKDQLLKDILDLISSSANSFLQTLFPDRVDPDSKKRPPTAGDRIKSSANALVTNLMQAQPSYIRTIKPNSHRSPTEYDDKAITHQIKYLGLQENIRVRRAGFAYRQAFDKFVERFYLLSPKTSYAGDYIWQGDSKTGAQRILQDCSIPTEEWQMGVTKVFIKSPETLFGLEHMRDRYWHNMAVRIQRAWRNYLAYRNECAIRIQRVWRKNKDGFVYVQLRDYGHQVLAGRKERRRFSLISQRRFMGDYLGVSNPKNDVGSMIAEACSISAAESVAFSAKIQLLVSRLGRSSRPSPRLLVITDKAVYIVAQTLEKRQLVMTMERKIPLITIKAVGLSNLRDDWIAVNVGSSEEGDPVFSCYFKTELVTHLLQRTNGAVDVKIGPTIEYSKKKDKSAAIKFTKDETVKKDDVYKSHEVRVPSGESPGSVSDPPAPKKAGVVRPITSGKLLRKGGPSTNTARTPKAAPRPAAKQPLPRSRPPAPAARPASTVKPPAPMPGNRPVAGAKPPAPAPRPNVKPAAPIPGGKPNAPPRPTTNGANGNAASAAAVAAAAPAARSVPPSIAQLGGIATPFAGPIGPGSLKKTPNGSANGSFTQPASRTPAPVPATKAAAAPAPAPRRSAPPKPPPAAPAEPTFKALYAFTGQDEGELSLAKGELVTIEQKDDNGWWLAKKKQDGTSGWCPSNYLAAS